MKATPDAAAAPTDRLKAQWDELTGTVRLLKSENKALRRDRDEWKRRALAAEKEAHRAS